jgi:hypothetical protein
VDDPYVYTGFFTLSDTITNDHTLIGMFKERFNNYAYGAQIKEANLKYLYYFTFHSYSGLLTHLSRGLTHAQQRFFLVPL